MADSHVINFNAMVQRLEPNSSPDNCIFKIHDGYVPRQIGLGLFHHSDTSNNIQIINEMKQEALNETLRGILNGMREEDLLQRVRRRLPNIKDCYSDSSNYFTGIDELLQAKYFALDACFIIQFYTSDINRLRHDDILMISITEDIFMFQNQVPLFLLLEIMEYVCGTKEAAVNRLVNSLARCQPFQTLLPFAISQHEAIIDFMKNQLTDGCNHLLHLLNKCIKHFLSPNTDTYTPGGLTAPITFYHHLERLDTYRVEFKVRNREVWFEKARWLKLSGTLHLPQIRLDEATAPLHRNLMNFARLTRQDKLICDLMFLMKCIVQERNEGIFREEGIIQGNGARFFEKISKLCDGVTGEAGRYKETINDLEEHCNAPFNRFLCSIDDFFKRHFSLAVVVSILSLVVSIVLGYIDHPKT